MSRLKLSVSEVAARFQIFSRDLLIGSSDMEYLDPPMGIASGSFSPAEGYQSVQSVFLIYSEAIFEADHDPEINRYYQERDGLNLTVQLGNGETVPVQCVHIEDYLAELNEIIVTIMLPDWLAFDQFFGDQASNFDEARNLFVRPGS